MCERPINEDWDSLLHLLGTDKECNLFEHIHGDKDIEELTAAVIRCSAESCRYATRIDEMADSSLLNALLALLYHYTPYEYQNIPNVMRLLRTGLEKTSPRSTSEKSLEEFICRLTGKKPVSEQYSLDDIFAEIEKTEPESFAVNQYKSFRVAAKRYTFLSCANRLQALNPTLEKLSVREFCGEQD